MKTTAAANRWLQTFVKWYSGRALLPVADLARSIARERHAHVLGRVHLVAALVALAGDGQQEQVKLSEVTR